MNHGIISTPSLLVLSFLALILTHTHYVCRSDYDQAYCVVPTNVEGNDGSTVCVEHGPGNLEKFMRSKYSSLWVKVDQKNNPQKYSAPSEIWEPIKRYREN